MAEHEPKYGYYSNETQRVANKLPQWNKIRLDRDSIGQQLLNVSATHLERINAGLEETLRNQFLEIATLDHPDQTRRIQLPPEIPLPAPIQIDNYLLNSSFELHTSQDRLPDRWQYTGTPPMLSSGLLGNKSLDLFPGIGNTTTVYQDIEQPIRAGVPWTYYIMFQSSATGLTPGAHEFELAVIGTKGDGTTETHSVQLQPDTHGLVLRALISEAFTADVSKVRFQVTVTSSIGFPIVTPVLIDMAMAAPGQDVTDWRPNLFDSYPYLDHYEGFAPVVIEHPHRVQYVERMNDFWERAVPTSVGMATLASTGGTPDPAPTPGDDGFTVVAEAGSFVEVDFWKKEWEGVWQLGTQGGASYIRGNTTAGDIIGPFDIGFRNWRGWINDGEVWTPEAMTSFHDHLYVVMKKRGIWGSKRYLAIVDPKTRRPFPTYLEAYALLEMQGISMAVTLTRASVRLSDQQWLFVGDGDSEWYLPLHYDYFMLDTTRNEILLREDYGVLAPQIAVRTRVDDVSTRRAL